MSSASEVSTVEMHHAHRDVAGGWLRPATFGVMDGLVSNFSLVAGVVGGGATGNAVLMTGLAGLVAGACSMASGEFTSVSSQADLIEAEIELERRELLIHPEEELLELTRMYERKGLRPGIADQVARELSADPAIALEVHVREELGVDPTDLPSPWTAAGASFVAFSIGALVPLLPFLVGSNEIMGSLLITVIGLLLIGGVVARITAKPVWYGGGRQLLLGGLSGAVTYGVGLLVGAGLA